MQVGQTLSVGTRSDWRGWLEGHHAAEKEIWVLFYKKSSGKTGLSYDDAVEEALCFGWIDGQLKSVSDEPYALRFTPRRPKGNWSESNKQRVHRLMELGLMAPAGLAALPSDLRDELSAKETEG